MTAGARPALEGYSFSREVPVREGDLDDHGRLLQSRARAHLEAAVADFLRARGFRWPTGLHLVLTEATLPHGDVGARNVSVRNAVTVTVAVRPAAIGYSALQFQGAICGPGGGGPLEEARLVYAVVDRASGRNVPIPACLVGALLRPA